MQALFHRGTGGREEYLVGVGGLHELCCEVVYACIHVGGECG